ncbi:MAG: hypothetical protein LLF76_14425 [Planctomycetaceae bacterium]|nr:hypothetical protein [Planctomycetaceae bacterium]
MKKREVVVGLVVSLVMVSLSGCGLRYAATQAQKQNAFLHAQVCGMAAQTAAEENASARLCALTALSARQSEAFVLDYGVPEELEHGQAELDRATHEEMTVVAETAMADAARQPDAWALADGALELAIALAGLLGGVYGARAAAFLKLAKDKSKALKEIVAGNELFKQLYPEQAQRFKEAQGRQSQTTKTIVTELK